MTSRFKEKLDFIRNACVKYFKAPIEAGLSIWQILSILFLLATLSAICAWTFDSLRIAPISLAIAIALWGIKRKNKKIKECAGIASSTLTQTPSEELKINNASHPRLNLEDLPEIKFTNITKLTNLEMVKNFVAVDVETTGLNPSKNRIVEIAAVRFENWKPAKKLHTYINPQCKIPQKTIAIHGITNEQVQDAPCFENIVDSLSDFIGELPIVGHNLIFDLKFLFCSGYDFTEIKKRKYYDTLTLASRVLIKEGSQRWNVQEGIYEDIEDDGDVEDYKLTTLCDYYGIRDNKNAHSASSDSHAAGLLFKHLIDDKMC